MNAAKLSAIQAATDHATAQKWRAEIILSALGGTVEGWEYRGVCMDLGKASGRCTCGHTIRFEFLIEKDGHSPVVLGSECINSYIFSEAILAACNADLAAMQEARKEAERRTRQLLEEAAVAEALAAFEPIYNEALALRNLKASRFVCSEVYRLRLPDFEEVGRADFWGVKTAKTLLARIARLRGECERAIAANAATPPQKFAAEVRRENNAGTVSHIEPLLVVLREKARESYGEFVCNMRDELESGKRTLAELPPRAFSILSDIWAKNSGARRGSKAYTAAVEKFEAMAEAQSTAAAAVRAAV